jgi:hypothetical protein
VRDAATCRRQRLAQRKQVLFIRRIRDSISSMIEIATGDS